VQRLFGVVMVVAGVWILVPLVACALR